MSRPGTAWQVQVRPGMAGRGTARLGAAWHGTARQGKAINFQKGFEMSKKKAAPKPRKGLAGAAEPGGAEISSREPIDVNIRRFAVALPLRDMFAAAALIGLIENGNRFWDDIPKLAYETADMMLEARK